LAEDIGRARTCGLPVQASVAVNRLVDYGALPNTLQRLRFDDVAFSYPRSKLQILLLVLEHRHLALRGVAPVTGVGIRPRRIPDQHEPCDACIMACYRTASMLIHAAVAAIDAARALTDGQVAATLPTLFRLSVAQSPWALTEETSKMRRQACRRRRAAADASWHHHWSSNEAIEA
jgi:hypothetical protein